LFCGGVYFFENFILFDFDNFNVILENPVLDAYEVDILHNIGRLQICAKCGFKSVHLDADYNFALAKMGVNLVTLTNELESPIFIILMSLKVSQREPKPQGAKQHPVCILDLFNKFLEVLTDEFLDALPPYREVDHKIKMVPKSTPLFKAPYKLNGKELE
jgi:hypothetical protein